MILYRSLYCDITYSKINIQQNNSKHCPQWRKIESIFSKTRNKTREPTLTTTTQHRFGSPSHSREEKEIKAIQIGKEEVKLSLYVNDLILYIENSKDATRKLLELIGEYSKVAGYKINTQISIVFLYTNNEISKGELKETITFNTATRRIKHLGIHLPKERKHLYTENYKTLMKELEDDTNR